MALLTGTAIGLGMLVLATAYAGAIIDVLEVGPVHGDRIAVQPIVDQLCQACHGAEGISPVPLFPNLAGQKVVYLQLQLARFKSGAWPDSPMTAVAEQLDAEELRSLAVYYAALSPATKPASMDDRPAFERGARLFRDGDPARAQPPCQGCHGANAQGLADVDGRYLAYPRLRHQKGEYMIGRLKAYRANTHDATDHQRIMQSVAANLDDTSIIALATWIASAP